MIKPILYMQTDPKYKNVDYSAVGEKTTIGAEGCGICCTAMAISTLKNNKNITPITTANWSKKHGYKALRQGTYYSYFVPQFAEYGITCRQINGGNTYGNITSMAHKIALDELKKGNWLIACMGKGRWTTSGHYVLIYGYANGYVYINDSYNTRVECSKAKLADFQREVKYYWCIDTQKFINNIPSISYRVWIKGKKWLSKVIDTTDYAGIKNQPFSCVKIDNISKVGRVKYRVHMLEKKSWGRYKIGGGIGVWSGGTKYMTDGIEIKLLDSNFYVLEYRTSTIGQKYGKWIRSDKELYSGTFGKVIDRLQIRVVKK